MHGSIIRTKQMHFLLFLFECILVILIVAARAEVGHLNMWKTFFVFTFWSLSRLNFQSVLPYIELQK